MSIYTKSERTVKKYTVGEALDSAKRALKSKGIYSVCTNAVYRRDLSEKITLEELNNIKEQIVSDSYFWY